MESPVGQSRQQQWLMRRGGEQGPQRWEGETMDGQYGVESRHWQQQGLTGLRVGDSDNGQGPWQQRQRQQDSRTTWQEQDSTTAWQQHDRHATLQQEEDSPIWQHRHTLHWKQLKQRYWQTCQHQEQQRRWQQQVLQQLIAGQQQRDEGRRVAVKRRCSSLWSGDQEEDSNEEETLPSSKRQRVSVSAMERLFAACSLGRGRARGCDAGRHHQAREGPITGGDNVSRARQEEKRQRGKKVGPAWPTGGFDMNQEAQYEGGEEVSRKLSSRPRVLDPLENRTNLLQKLEEGDATHLRGSENKDGDIDGPPPTTEQEPDASPAKVDDRGTAAHRHSGSEDNKSSVEVGQGSGQKIAKCSSSGSVKQRAVSTGKRSAEEEEEEVEKERDVQHNSDDVVQHTSKRVRTLKRGLRLCSNITCYIEQVLYNC